VLNILYPPCLLLLAFFSFLVGVFINMALIDTRQLVILLVWIPIFTIPFLISGKKVFYYLVCALCFINGFVNLAHWILVNGPVTASGLFVLFNTNLEEAFGFAQLKNSYEYFLLLPYVILFILALRFPPQQKVANRKVKYMLVSIIGIVCLSFIAENTIHGRLVRKGIPILFKSIISFEQQVKALNQLKAQTDFRLHAIKAKAVSIKQPQIIIVIMGESTNRNHMSLYGYYRNTNPLLRQAKNLIVYDNVISGYAHTLESVPAALSQADLNNKLTPASSVTLAEVFRASGYKTFWLSNQSPLGVWDNMITVFAGQYETLDFVNTSGSSSLEALEKRSYDSRLFLPFQKTLASSGTKKLIVLHLMGTHSQYRKRYPARFDRFKDNKSEKAKTIAEYDNAVLYNDFVVDSLLKIISRYSIKNKAVSAVVYLSDHGENVYDSGNYAGHDYTGSLPTCLVEVPFMVWLSPEYQKIFPEKADVIEQHCHLPFVTDDLFYALIDISGIETPVFLPEKSVFNRRFDGQRKRILVDGEDYDQKKR